MTEPAASLEALSEKLRASYPDLDTEPLERAYALLGEQQPGRGFSLEQILAAAGDLVRMRLDPAAVTALLLAGLDPAAALGLDLKERFGAEVESLVKGVAKLARIRWDRIEEEAAETLRKMFLAMAQDVRVVLIALALRVQLMRRLPALADPDEGRRIARETLEVFAPLANRLGIWQLKWELEDWSLRQLEPQIFAELQQLLNERRSEREAFIEQVTAILSERLAREGIEASVKGRAKHIYSIYKKMQHKQVSFDQIYDVSALRVLTARVGDCYAVLGLVHSLWKPLPGEFDDYIARPKENLYQSLHTAVMGPEGKPVEVQIRTHEMHAYAEHGVAAHWAYKEPGRVGVRRGDQEKFMVLRQLMDWERELTDPLQFVESLKTDIFKDQVYVFTPAGDIVDLPVGSTPLDFAYRIHTQVGHRCRGARVNDQIQPLDYQLRTGDRVAILTQKQPRPSQDWMNPNLGYLRTSGARQKVRGWFRAQSREQAVAEGRELVDKELSRLELAHATIAEIAGQLKYGSPEDLYAAIGYGDRSPQAVASTALAIERDKAPPSEPPVPPSEPVSRRKRTVVGVSLQGVDDILSTRARCCNPVPGDNVIGYVSRGRGIMIHRRDCPHMASHNEPERLVEIDWGGGQVHPVNIAIKAYDRPGLLRDMTNLIANAGVNMRSAKAEGHKDGTASLRLSLELSSAEQVVKVLQLIAAHKDVLEVRRVGR